ncbi:MAG: hypothetical protein WDO69_27125 [Pseudomonadota bacterium]
MQGQSASIAPPSSDRALLANLLELYLHDLSETFAVIQLGVDGRFGYPRLASYWSEPEVRFPFLIRNRGELVGFALVQRGSPMSDDPEVFDVAEFFHSAQCSPHGRGRPRCGTTVGSLAWSLDRARCRSKSQRAAVLDACHPELRGQLGDANAAP